MLTISVTDVFVACCALGKASGYDSSVKTLFPCLRWSLQSEAGSAGSRFPGGPGEWHLCGARRRSPSLGPGPLARSGQLLLAEPAPRPIHCPRAGKRGKAEQTQGAATGAFPLVCPFPKLQSFSILISPATF